MDIIIDLDLQNHYLPHQLELIPCISSLVFSFVVNSSFDENIQEVFTYLKFLQSRPLIKTGFALKNIDQYKGQKFSQVALGGTFDYLHLGHQILLLYGVLSTEKQIQIGVTGSVLLQKKKLKQLIEPIEERMKNVKQFILTIKSDISIQIFQLQDPYGRAITLEELKGLIVSEETITGANQINNLRRQKNLNEVKIIICPTASLSKDINKKISSSNIRDQIYSKSNFTGEYYLKYLNYWQNLINKMKKLGKYKENNIFNKWWKIIVHHYSQYWRFYHTNYHILTLLNNWNSQKFQLKRNSLTLEDSIAIELSIFFHDIIYVTNSETNEQQSLKSCIDFIHQFYEQHLQVDSLIKKVSQIILQTKNHKPSTDLSAIMYDLDMGILDQKLPLYKEYCKKIKNEYLPVFGNEYEKKRVQFLKSLLLNKPYFSFQITNYYSNIEWQIHCLENNDL